MQSGKKRREIAKIKGKIRLISKDNVLVAVVIWLKTMQSGKKRREIAKIKPKSKE